MAVVQIPPYTVLSDGQFVQVAGPDGITSGYHYDEQQRALYFKESQVLFPNLHGASHIAEDPVPSATCDTPGLLSADDKCKLDAFIGTRLGVLGFSGAGFPDDGGWMQGDIILAAGTDFISLERIGNIIRFTVDSPVPLNCDCFKAGARVLMADGTTKAIEDIIIGDMVVTHTGAIKPVLSLIRNHHDGIVYNWKVDKHSGESFAATGNHPILAAKKAAVLTNSSEEETEEIVDWIKAEELSAGDKVVRRRSHIFEEQIHTIDVLSELGEGFKERNGKVYPCIVGGSRDGQINGMALGIPRYLDVNDDLLDLIGYYAAEGSADIPNGLRFTIHTDELTFGEIGFEIRRKLSNVFGLEAKVQNKTNTENAKDIQINCKVLGALFLKWLGIGNSKEYPKWVMNLPAKQQLRVLGALIKGDGYITKSGKNDYVNIGLTARGLIDQSLFIAERCGFEPSNCPPKDGKRWRKGASMRYRMRITLNMADALCELLGIENNNASFNRETHVNDHVLHTISKVREEYYVGPVYNFEVRDDNSYIIDGVVVHNCEECQQIFWVQDETDISSIRPPTCGGKLPGVNAYGEMKIYLFPESTIADPNDVASTINNKGIYPAMIFKRYDDTIVPGAAEYELILKRDVANTLQTEIGWAFTPGALGVAENVWFMGKDDDGGQIRFDMEPELTPGLLGSVLFNGHLITKRMGVVTAYTSTVLNTNQYTIRKWDTDANAAIGDSFTAQNVWQYQNPENPASGSDPQAIILDATIDLLPIGTLVDLWAFKIGEISGEPILRYYFREKPHLNPAKMWTWVGRQQFGDTAIAREEVNTSAANTANDVDDAVQVSAIRAFANSQWGLTGLDDPLLDFDIVSTEGTENADLTTQHRAVIDTSIPGLLVVDSVDNLQTIFSERPVWLWNRHTLCNKVFRIDMGRPDSSDFTPYDVVFRAPIDEFTNIYMKVTEIGTVSGLNYIKIVGANFADLPSLGTVRIINRNEPNNANANLVFNYTRKMLSAEDPANTVVLSSDSSDNTPYPGAAGDIVELLHQEYTSPVVRIEFSFNPSTELIQVQFKVGILDMSVAYEDDQALDDVDDYVRGLQAGYAVSAIYSQAGIFTGVGAQPDSSVEGFVVYDGGAQVGGDEDEYWNRLELMVRDDQVWLWWNQLLIPPSTTASASLSTPVVIDTPYYPTDNDVNTRFGKCGVRMWPGSTVRRLDVRTQLTIFNEFTYGQLEIT